MSVTGHCLCGAVTYSADTVDSHYHACHCDMCRRWSGGPGMGVRADNVVFNDDAKVKAYQSSEWAERGFCIECGSNLFYRMPSMGMTILWSGTLDDQQALEMSGEIYVDEKPASYCFAGDHPRQTGAEFLASMGVAPDG
ncbi:MAG: GFA family protein [Pseudomonadota bacterium]